MRQFLMGLALRRWITLVYANGHVMGDGPLKIGRTTSRVRWIKLGRWEFGYSSSAGLIPNRLFHPRYGYRHRVGMRFLPYSIGLEIEGRPAWP